jgi:lipopolysaccharide transport system ATP-binding protein
VRPAEGDVLTISSGMTFSIEFYNNLENINLDVTFELKSVDETAVFHHGVLLSQNRDSKTGIYQVTGKLPPYLINAGVYKFKMIFGENQKYLLLMQDDFIQFEVVNETAGSNTAILPGVLRLNFPFEVNMLEYEPEGR